MTITDAILTSSNVPETDYTAWSATGLYIIGEYVRVVAADVHLVFESLVGIRSVVTISIAAPGVVAWPGHGQAAGTPVKFTTTGTLPTGLAVGTVYYVLAPAADTFQLSATLGGAAITTTGTQSGVHTATASTNYNKAPAATPSVWRADGMTNRWKMFDLLRNTQTEVSSPLIVTLTPGVRNGAVALLGLVGDVVTIAGTSGGVPVYSHTETLTTREVFNWMDWHYAPFSSRPSVVVFDIPMYTDIVLTVTVTRSTGTVKCGSCVIGTGIYIGDVQYGAQSDTINFSKIERNAFGDAELLPRRNIPKSNQTLWLDKPRLNSVRALRDQLNAAPAVWCGLDDVTDDYAEALQILGIYKSFGIDITSPVHAIISLELEEI